MWNAILHTLIVYILYLQVGGIVFLCFEHFLEPKMADGIQNSTLHNFSTLESILLKKNFTSKEISAAVQAWTPGMEIVTTSPNDTLKNSNWTFFKAGVFSFDITTKIGYGNIVPTTLIGQIMCVVYAFLGIPISFLFLELLGDSFTEAYMKTAWLIPRAKLGIAGKIWTKSAFFAIWAVVLIILPSVVFMFTEKWNFFDGVYYTVVTVTTVGLGDYVAGEKLQNYGFYVAYKLALFWWTIYGLAFYLVVVNLMARFYARNCLYTIHLNWTNRKLEFRKGNIESLDFQGIKSEHRALGSSVLEEKSVVRKQQELDDLTEKLRVLILAELQKRQIKLN